MCNRSSIGMAVLTAAVGLVLVAGPARAQLVFGQPPQAGVNLVATHWTLTVDDDEVTIDQFAIPATVFVPLRDNLEARVYVAQAMTTVSQLGADYNLDGLTDLRVQVNQSLAHDRLLLGVGLNLPTGHTGLTMDEEWVVMNYLSQSFLSFPVRRLGSGFGLNFMVGGATDFGDYRLGASATYDIAGSYTAYLDQGDYKPGNTFNLTVGAQREAEAWFVNGDLTFTTSAEDNLASQPVYGRGDQLLIHLGASGKSSRLRCYGDTYYYVRGRNTIYDPAGILLQQLKVYGNEFVLGSGLDVQGGSNWVYGPWLDLRLIDGNEFGFGKSTVLGLGGHVARTLTPHLDVRLALKYFTGSTHDGAIDLTGYQAWLTVGGTF
jgi:hypothetical protein